MKCVAHRIAAGPDGRCVLCRREERARAARRLGWLSVLGLVAASGALLLVRPLRTVVLSASPSLPAVEPQAVAEPARAAAPSPREEYAAPEPARTAPPATSALAAVSAAPAASASAAPSAAPPTQAAIDAAMRSTRIEMFATAWCGVCKRARAFLAANGLSYRERDIDSDPAARAELQRRAGKTAVPTFEIDGELLPAGFSESSLTRAVAASVERRLGVGGIQIVDRSR